MKTDNTIFVSSGNVFADLGYPEPEATIHLMRSKLMIQIERMIKDQKLTQVQAAKKLHVSQARISDLMRGKIEKFSLESLVEFALRMGKTIDSTLHDVDRQAA